MTFQYDGLQLDLVSRRQVQMIAPPALAARRAAGEHVGIWLELRDQQEAVLYQRDLSRLIGAEAEAFNPDGTITHLVGAPGSGQFEVVVPDVAEAESVCVIASAIEGTRAFREPAREIARFSLRGAERR